MKKFVGFFICLALIACNTQESDLNITNDIDSTETISEEMISGYDSLYAQELGADDYGMKPYVMAFLKPGPNQDVDSITQVELGRGHMDNINRLAEEGKLVLAGPFYNNPDSDLAGIYIFDVATIEEAEELTMTDPAVEAGYFDMELLLWYGSAALMEVNNIHERIAKENP